MKRITILLFSLTAAVSCQTSLRLPERDFRADMRNFVISITDYAHNTASSGKNPAFIVIPQNGQEIITVNGEPDGTLVTAYTQAIDGVGREDLYYGYQADNTATPDPERLYFENYLNRLEAAGVQALVTDYCSDITKMDDSYSRNNGKDYISFAAPERNLNVIPDYPDIPYPHTTADETNYSVNNLSDARNFLYLINPDDNDPPSSYGNNNFPTKTDFLNALANTDYDIIIMDAFYGADEYTDTEITELKTKKDGGTRLVIAYMSIGEAEDYRFYWKNEWKTNPPVWLGEENPDWEGNYKVWYWEKEWQNIIISDPDSYLQRILNAGFDGVYLDIIDAFEYFENY